MTISYIISGTKPNLSIQATDGNGTVVTVSYNTNDPMQNAYSAIRNAFVDAYLSTISFDCSYSGTGNTRSCTSTDSYGNIITHIADITQSTDNVRKNTIGSFVDFYGMSDDNALYQELEDY